MKTILLSPLLLVTSVVAQVPDSSSALYSMREAEQNFARASVSVGRNAAFVKYFADESVLFADKWLTNGRQFWQNLKASPVVLKWEPEFMDISESRDFGISTGPWEAQEYRPNTVPLSIGYFLTVWKKQLGGEWKVILDAGSSTPAKSGSQHSFSFPPGADKEISQPSKINIELSCRELLDREYQLLMEWQKKPLPSTYSSFLYPNARIQGNGYLPSTNSDTINFRISRFDKTLVWKPVGAGAASSGDMGFTYGLLQIQSNPEVIKGHYVRIWKKRPGDNWRIVLDMINMD